MILTVEGVPVAGERVRVCAGWELMPGIFDGENLRNIDLWGVRGVWVAGAERDDRGRCRESSGEKRVRVTVWGLWWQIPGSCLSFPGRSVGIFAL